MDKQLKLSSLLTVGEVARATGWKESTVRQKVWLREIEYVKLGRSIRFRAETIQEMIERNTIPIQNPNR